MNLEWEIHHTHRDVIDVHDGLIVLEWKLNRAPESEWIKYFITGPGQKSGTMDFITRQPEVVGSKISFAVREVDLETAVRWIESRIDGTNQTFDTYVMSRRREQDAQRQAEKTVKDRQLQEARQRLEQMDS